MSGQRFKTQRTRGGPVVQAGLDVRHQANPHSRATPKLGIYRGLVLNTITPLLSSGTANPDNRRRYQIECDVLLIRTHFILQRVPVLQRAFGINEAHNPWIPKPSSRTLDGQDLRFSVLGKNGNFEGPATVFDNTDGDMVAIQFIEGDPDYPVITGALTHENTNRRLRQGSGWSEGSTSSRGNPEQDEYYVHHQGTEIRVNGDGDLLLDTGGAYSDRSTEDNSSSGGQVRIRVKDGQKLTIAMGDDEDTLEIFKEAGQLRIDLGEAADERIILGDTFLTFFNAHVHPTGVGPSDKPTIPMDATMLSDVSKTKKS